jgi:hypothetical protein
MCSKDTFIEWPAWRSHTDAARVTVLKRILNDPTADNRHRIFLVGGSCPRRTRRTVLGADSFDAVRRQNFCGLRELGAPWTLCACVVNVLCVGSLFPNDSFMIAWGVNFQFLLYIHVTVNVAWCT